MNKIYFMKIQNTENQLPHYLLFLDSCLLEQLLFQKTLPSIAAAFPEELLFYNILFQKSYYFIVTIYTFSYGSFPQLHFSFVC